MSGGCSIGFLPAVIAMFFTFLCNLGFMALSIYSLVGVLKLWKKENVTMSIENPETLVNVRIKEFDTEDKNLYIWCGVCIAVYAACVIFTIGYVCTRKKMSVCWPVGYIFSSIGSILITDAVIILYILSYVGYFKNEVISENLDELENKVEVGLAAGIGIVYTIAYFMLVIYVWKKAFNFSKRQSSKMDYVNGGGIVEEVGSPHDLHGFRMYTGRPPGGDKADGRPNRQNRKVTPVRNPRAEPDNQRSDSQEYPDVTQDPYDADQKGLGSNSTYSSIDRRTKPVDPSAKSSFRPQSGVKLNSDSYAVRRYGVNPKEQRSQRLSEYQMMAAEENRLSTASGHSNHAFEGDNYQIPRPELFKAP